jgi:adenylate cyclase
MKRCPECRRNYIDDSLLYCLEDGAALIQGAVQSPDESATAILPQEPPTRILTDANEGRETSDTRSPSNRNLFIVSVLCAFIVSGVGIAAYFYLRTPNAKQINSIAVMPFINDSGNTDLEYLSDGMTETLISSLSQLPNLNVKARSSVFRYKGKEIDPQKIGKELNVQAILNGRVVQRGQSLILNVELIDVKTENVLWGQDYTRQQTDLVALQTEIARDVSNKLRSKLSGVDEQNLTKNYPADPEAYQLYLKGRYAWNKFTPVESQKAAEYFNQAIAKDPSYALAYVGLADTYGASAANSWILPSDGYSKAKAAVQTALSIDPKLAQAHASLGALIMFADFDWAAAEQEFKRAEELDSNYELTYELYSYLFSALGRHDEAIATARRGLEVDPLSNPLSDDLGEAYYLARDYDQSIKQNQKTLELEPDRAFSYIGLGSAYVQKGLYDDAIAANQKAVSLAGRTSVFLSPLGHAYARAGKRDEAIAILNEMREVSKGSYVSPYDIAILYTGLGDKENAIDQLQKAYEERAGWMIYLKVEPQFDPLRSDPRFQELIRKMGLP